MVEEDSAEMLKFVLIIRERKGLKIDPWGTPREKKNSTLFLH